jgi:hypothetical protein
MVVFDGGHHQGPLLGSVSPAIKSFRGMVIYRGSFWWPGSNFLVTITCDGEHKLGPSFDLIQSNPDIEDGNIVYRACRHEKLIWRFKKWRYYCVIIDNNGEHHARQV